MALARLLPEMAVNAVAEGMLFLPADPELREEDQTEDPEEYPEEDQQKKYDHDHDEQGHDDEGHDAEDHDEDRDGAHDEDRVQDHGGHEDETEDLEEDQAWGRKDQAEEDGAEDGPGPDGCPGGDGRPVPIFCGSHL